MVDQPFIYVPLDQLPFDADPAADRPSKYTFGTDIFGGSSDWIIVENGTDPVKVYKLPPPVGRIINFMSKTRYDSGCDDAQRKMRRALGLE